MCAVVRQSVQYIGSMQVANLLTVAGLDDCLLMQDGAAPSSFLFDPACIQIVVGRIMCNKIYLEMILELFV